MNNSFFHHGIETSFSMGTIVYLSCATMRFDQETRKHFALVLRSYRMFYKSMYTPVTTFIYDYCTLLSEASTASALVDSHFECAVEFHKINCRLNINPYQRKCIHRCCGCITGNNPTQLNTSIKCRISNILLM